MVGDEAGSTTCCWLHFVLTGPQERNHHFVRGELVRNRPDPIAAFKTVVKCALLDIFHLGDDLLVIT